MGAQKPWEEPLEEEYWEALLQQGEFSPDSMPPAEPEEILRDWGARLPAPLGKEGEQGLWEQDWQRAEECLAADEVVELEVTGYNRGGLLVQWGNLTGFVPLSHLVRMPRWNSEEEKLGHLAARVGSTIKLRVLEIDRLRNRLLFSERMALDEEEIWNEIQEGKVLRGKVSNLCSFGAFVDLGGGIEGLIHVSELSWGRVEHPKDMLQLGQEVDVYVMSVDPRERRVALSLKRLQPDPWNGVDERYKVGQIVKGVITNVVDFGAFARLEEGVEGLIHISELAEGNFLHPRNVVNEGDEVWVRIIHIDSQNRRLGLSMRRVRAPDLNRQR